MRRTSVCSVTPPPDLSAVAVVGWEIRLVDRSGNSPSWHRRAPAARRGRCPLGDLMLNLGRAQGGKPGQSSWVRYFGAPATQLGQSARRYVRVRNIMMILNLAERLDRDGRLC